MKKLIKLQRERTELLRQVCMGFDEAIPRLEEVNKEIEEIVNENFRKASI